MVHREVVSLLERTIHMQGGREKIGTIDGTCSGSAQIGLDARAHVCGAQSVQEEGID
jgi:hypothetical protein